MEQRIVPYIVLHALYLVVIIGELLLVRLTLYYTSNTSNTTPELPEWFRRTQQTLPPLVGIFAFAYGICGLCLYALRKSYAVYATRIVLFSTVLCAEVAMLTDAAVLCYVGKWSKRWKYAPAVVVALGLASIVLVSVSQLSQRLELLARWAPPVFATLIESSIAVAQTYRVWKTDGSFKHKWCLAISLASREVSIIPLWVWTMLYSGESMPGMTVCQLLQLLLLVYPSRYSPCACMMRKDLKKARSERRREISLELSDAHRSNGSRPPTEGGGSESTKELVLHNPNDECRL